MPRIGSEITFFTLHFSARSLSCKIFVVISNPFKGPNYKGYGHDYLWMPGAKDTFKASNTAEFTTVNVEADFTITYNNPKKEADERFANRVKWWEPNGPSICRFFNKYAYLPGIERPKLRNDDGSLDFDFL